LRVEDPEQLLSWAVRQAGVNHADESMTLWSLHYELLVRLWPEVPRPEAFAAEDAFRRYTNMTLRDYLTFGFGAYGRFVGFAENPETGIVIEPDGWFSKTKVSEADWRPFFELTARPLEQLREAINQEERAYGRTTYGCHSFAETPLLEVGQGRYAPINLAIFERRVTEGIFFVLADGAQDEGLPREQFTGPYGAVFEEHVRRTFKRVAGPQGGVVRVHGDFEYGPRKERMRSSDVILDYGEELVFVECVAGQLRVATRTRGDLTSLRQDLRKLVLGKAKQLDRCIRHFRTGRLQPPDFKGPRDARIWPIVVVSMSFPLIPPVADEIAIRLRQNALLRGSGVGPLCVITAEELASAEGLVERGASFLDLIRGWQGDRVARRHAFKNYLASDVAGGAGIPPASHQAEVFEEAMSEMVTRLFDRDAAVAALRRARPTQPSAGPD
jgi:hypothetical protein